MGGQREAGAWRIRQVNRLLYFIVHIKSKACRGLVARNWCVGSRSQNSSAEEEWHCNIVGFDFILYYTPLKLHII